MPTLLPTSTILGLRVMAVRFILLTVLPPWRDKMPFLSIISTSASNSGIRSKILLFLLPGKGIFRRTLRVLTLTVIVVSATPGPASVDTKVVKKHLFLAKPTLTFLLLHWNGIAFWNMDFYAFETHYCFGPELFQTRNAYFFPTQSQNCVGV